MAARRSTAARVPAADVPTSDTPAPTVAEPAVSFSGALLDPVDGQPVFADGMSRRRYLEAHADERKAQLIAELRASSDDTETE